MRVWLLAMVAGCVPGDVEDVELAPQQGDAAVYRVRPGDSLSVIADDVLHVPGSWPALQRALGKQSPELRADEGLAIPLSLLPAGLDPYADLGLEHYEPALSRDPLVPCRTFEQRGSDCIELGASTACVETTPPVAVEDPDRDTCVYAADDSAECPYAIGRTLVVYRDGKAVHTLGLPTKSRQWDEPEVDGHLVDLDNDRADDLVLAVPLHVHSRGGYETWRVFVIDGRTSAVTQLDIQQWGEGSIVANDHATCDLLVTSWDDSWNGPPLNPLDTGGVYLVGRRYAFENATLLPIGERVVRRMRDYFHVSQGDDRATPAAWLSGPETTRWRDLAPARDYRPGTLTAIDARRTGLVVDIALADGTQVHLDAAGDGAARLRRLGWAATSSPLPEMYVPGDVASWVGSRVLVDRFEPVDDSGETNFDYGREVWIAR